MYQTEAPGPDFLQNHHISLYILPQGYRYFFNLLCHFYHHSLRFVRCAINLHLTLNSLFPSFHLFEHIYTECYFFFSGRVWTYFLVDVVSLVSKFSFLFKRNDSPMRGCSWQNRFYFL